MKSTFKNFSFHKLSLFLFLSFWLFFSKILTIDSFIVFQCVVSLRNSFLSTFLKNSDNWFIYHLSMCCISKKFFSFHFSQKFWQLIHLSYFNVLYLLEILFLPLFPKILTIDSFIIFQCVVSLRNSFPSTFPKNSDNWFIYHLSMCCISKKFFSFHFSQKFWQLIHLSYFNVLYLLEILFLPLFPKILTIDSFIIFQCVVSLRNSFPSTFLKNSDNWFFYHLTMCCIS